jgi:hypothetical protein
VGWEKLFWFFRDGLCVGKNQMCGGKKNKKHRVGLNIPVKLEYAVYGNN